MPPEDLDEQLAATAASAAAAADEPICQYGEPVLRLKAKRITRVNAAVRALAERMAQTMYDVHGVGLAAPQVGEPRRLVVVDIGDGLMTLINPQVIHAEGSEVADEACLSVRGLCGEVERHSRVRVRYKDLDGKEQTIEAEGLLARVLQHELDHLDGVLFIDRAKSVERIAAREPDTSLSVVFIGTPGFAVPCLQAVAQSHHHVKLVVTCPPRRAGRGMKMVPTAVMCAAEELELPVAAVEPGDASGLATLLAGVPHDVLLVVAWGGMVSDEALAQPSLAALNLHPSLLPRWRGAAPIERAIMAGDDVTGVTIQYMAAELDAGDVLLQAELPLPREATKGEMVEILAEAGGELAVVALAALAAGHAPRVPQDQAGVTWAPKLTADDERISWQASAREVVDRVRALSPVPAAYFAFQGQRVKVLRAREHRPQAADAAGAPDSIVDPVPGIILDCSQTSFLVATGQGGAVWIERVKAAGSREATGAAFLVGRRLARGSVLDEEGGA